MLINAESLQSGEFADRKFDVCICGGGAAGITLDFCPMRHAMNLESVITYEGTESVHQLIVGRALTGENAF